MNNRLEIDLLNLTENSSELLEKLLVRKRRNGGLIKRGKVFWVGLSRVSVSHDIVMREKQAGVWRYDVLDNNNCGAGKSGTVYKVISVLQLTSGANREHLISTPKQKRVYKVQKNAAINEYELMLRCSHLRTRALFPGVPSYITMRQLPGVMLNDALNEERRGQPFSHLERYKITIGLLRALKKQIHDNMICHRDIKPDNIFYCAETGEINIFDLGTSNLIGDTLDMRSRGNATFSAPEEFISVRTGKPITVGELRVSAGMMSQSTVKADILSIAEVIRLVWRDVDPKFFIENADHLTLMKRRIHHKWRPNFNLFQGLSSVSVEEKDEIQNYLIKMTSVSPDQRPDLVECIAFFEQAYLEYKLTKIPVGFREEVIRTHRLALAVVSKLDEIERFHDVCVRVQQTYLFLGVDSRLPLQDFINLLNRKLNYKLNVLAFEAANAFSKAGISIELSLKQAVDALTLQSSFGALVNILREAVFDLDDSPYAVAEFIEVCEIRCLDDVSSKQSLLTSLEKIQKDFSLNFIKMMQLYEDVETGGDQSLIRDMDHFFRKMQNESMSIESVKKVSQHLHRKHIKLATIYQDPHSEMSMQTRNL